MFNSELMREYIDILEKGPDTQDSNDVNVNPNISYEEMATKVIANLKSYDSGRYTRLAKNLLTIQEYKEEIKRLEADVKQDTRELVADLFEAKHAAFTRVVNTVSFTFTLSKDPKPTTTYKYAEILKELENHLTEDLKTVLKEIKGKYESVSVRQPSLKIEPREKVVKEQDLYENRVSEIISKIKGYLRKFRNKIMNWAEGYDRKLNALMSKAERANIL